MGTFKLVFCRNVDKNNGIHPPQSADLPKARYTFPGVMIALLSDARIQSIAALISRSEIFWQWQTIIGIDLVGSGL